MQKVISKESSEHVEQSKGADAESQDRYSEKEYTRIKRRIDFRLIPALGLMFGISLMDRKNVSNAAIAGMTEDLDLNVGYRYSLITLCFFITYVLVQAPMTIVCRKLGPRLFLPGVCLAWGTVIIGFGFANNWSTLVGLRLVLGLLEAGYFPGCVYLLSTWYTRYESAKRYSFFYLIGVCFSAFAGVLAYGLMQMEGLNGIRGWRWIFIIEGVITVAIALVAFSLIIRFPDQERLKPTYRFLKPDECDYVIERLNRDRGDVEAEPFSWQRFLKPARDWDIWAYGFMQFCITTTTYSYAFYLPIILRETLGFSVGISQCLSAPPYVGAAFLMLLTAWYGDRRRVRAPMIILNCVIALIGLPIAGFAKDPWVRYFGVFIAVAGSNSNVPTIMTYQANNIRGQWRRAFCSATLTGLGGIGGISGSLIYRTQDAPQYIPGVLATIVCNFAVMLTCVALSIYFRRRNRKADKGELIINDSVEFRYTL